MVLWFHEYRQSLSTYSPGSLGSATSSHGMRRRLEDSTSVNLRSFANLEAKIIFWDFNMDQTPRTGFDVQAGRRIGRFYLLPMSIEIHGRYEACERSVIVVPTAPGAVVRVAIAIGGSAVSFGINWNIGISIIDGREIMQQSGLAAK